MLGAYRYLLSLLVVFNHHVWMVFDHVNWMGQYPVYTFYTLSGFLMTLVLHKTYGYGVGGCIRFLFNRCLRLYPAYWVAITTTIALLLVFPDAPASKGNMLVPDHSHIVYLPERLGGYLWNYGILFMTWGVKPALVFPVWSLHVELVWYLFMGLGLSSRRWLTVVWFAASVAWTAWAIYFDYGFGARYSDVSGASLSVASGAMAWHFRHWRRPWMVVTPALYFLNDFAASHLYDDVLMTGWYVSLALGTLSILYLSGLRPSRKVAYWDRRLGDLAYPMFLYHLQIGYLIQTVAPVEWFTSFWTLFLLAVVPVHIAAWVIDVTVVEPIENLRKNFQLRGVATELRPGASAPG